MLLVLNINYYIININKLIIIKLNIVMNCKYNLKSNNGDWGLGIGDWAQSPIPNPQSPLNLV